VTVLTTDGNVIFSTSDFNFQPPARLRNPVNYKSICLVPGILLNAGNNIERVDFDIPFTKAFFIGLPITFTISELIYNQFGLTIASRTPGVVHPFINWEFQ